MKTNNFKNTISEGVTRLQKGVVNLQGIAVERALQVVRNYIVDESKNPKHPLVSGRLLGSIQGSLIGDVYNKSDTVYNLQTRQSKTKGVIGTSVEYAEKIELFSKKNRGFFTEGFYNSKRDVEIVIKNTLKDGINANSN